MSRSIIPFLLLILCASYLFSDEILQEEQSPAVSYAADAADAETGLRQRVSGILRGSCATGGCHRGGHPKAKLNLEPGKFAEAMVNVPSRQIESLKLIDRANPQKSYLLMKIKGEKGIRGDRMPEHAPPMKEESVAIIEDWIRGLKDASDGSEVQEVGAENVVTELSGEKAASRGTDVKVEKSEAGETVVNREKQEITEMEANTEKGGQQGK